MRKVSLVILFIFIILGLYAEGLEVRSLAIDNLDMHGSVSPVVDSNGDNCALIRIEHNLAGDVHLTDVEVFRREKKTDKIIYFYISKWEQSVTIAPAEKYLPIKYSFPEPLKPEKTYVMRLYGDGEGDELEDIPVLIITEPEGAEVYINDIKLSRKTPVSDFFISGTYPIRLELDEYVSMVSEITIAGERVEKSYTLQPDFGELEIISEPEVNLEILLNGKSAGYTPLNLERCKAGEYTISTKHRYYSSENITFNMGRGESKNITITAIPEFGNLEIISEPEVNVTVYASNQKLGVTPFSIDKAAIGEYRLRAEHAEYYAKEQVFKLDRGEDKKIIFAVKADFGNMKIVSEPEVNMTVFIDGLEVGKTPLNLDKYALGDYNIEVEHEYYRAKSQFISLKSGEKRNVIFQPKENFGRLIIRSKPEIGFEVSLNDEIVGKTPLDLKKQIEGKYKISSKHELYSCADQVIDLAASEEKEVVLSAQQNFGTLSIETLAGAKVYLNGEVLQELDNQKLMPQTLNLRAELAKHGDAVKKEILHKGDELNIKLIPQPLTGTVMINPFPVDASVKLFGDSGEYYESQGIGKFIDIPVGKYRVELEHPAYVKTIDEFILAEGDRQKLTIDMIDAELGFSLNIPAELQEELIVKLYNLNKSGKREVKLAKQDTLYLVGESGEHQLEISWRQQLVYSQKIEINSEQFPNLKLGYMKYITPSEKSKLYVDDKYKGIGKELLVVGSENTAKVKIVLPRFSDYRSQITLKKEYSQYSLTKSRDYFQRAYGIPVTLKQWNNKTFYGIKLPVISSPAYARFYGIEANLFYAGNISKMYGILPGNFKGEFNGFAISPLATCSEDFNGVAISGLVSGSMDSFRGACLSIFLSGSQDFKGFAFSGAAVTPIDQGKIADFDGIALAGGYIGYRNFKGIAFTGGYMGCNKIEGVSVGSVLLCNELKGISLSLMTYCVGSYKGFHTYRPYKSDYTGINISVICSVVGPMKGLQISLVNASSQLTGVQIGLVNFASKVKGVQIGLLNVSDGKKVRGRSYPQRNIFPLIHFKF
ncbi:MAG: PEGA domain-containing protein [Candidatus Cloacimonetes bacterium]|nr:PEGA domain-containing protein [Candidatus Cloacimonadota bacterium]